MLVFLNGKFVSEEKAVVSVLDRGFLYGDGLFETLRIFNGRPFRWPQHWERLWQGAEFLKIKLPFKPAKMLAYAGELIAKNKMPDALLRITLSRGFGAPGYSPNNASSPTLVMTMRTAPKIARTTPPQWRLMVSSFRLMAGDPLAGYKTMNKLPQVLALAEAAATGADEALLVNTDGFIAEGASSNVFWIKRGMLYTPPLVAGILPGVTRMTVMEIAGRLRISIRQQNIRPAELTRMEGVFLSLTSMGIAEVKSLDGKILKKSPVTTQLACAYNEMLMSSCACNAASKT